MHSCQIVKNGRKITSLNLSAKPNGQFDLSLNQFMLWGRKLGIQMRFRNQTRVAGIEPAISEPKSDALPFGNTPIIGGNETSKPPPINFIFCFNPPYPQCLIVLWVYCHNISCRYGFPWTSCLVRNAGYENPNTSASYFLTSDKVMAIRSTS